MPIVRLRSGLGGILCDQCRQGGDTSAVASAVEAQGILFVALNLLLATSASRGSQDGRVRHVEVMNKAKAVHAGADPNFKVASLRRCMLMSSICPEDGRDGETSSRHVDDTAVSADLWNGAGLVIHKVPEFQLSEACGFATVLVTRTWSPSCGGCLCQAAWQRYWWHLVVKLLGGRAPQAQFTV